MIAERKAQSARRLALGAWRFPLCASRFALSALRLPPAAWRFPLCALAAYWLLLIRQLGAQWSVFEQYNYGWSVPFLCLYLIWQRLCSPESAVRSPQSNWTRSGVRGLVVPWSRGPVVFLLSLALLYAPTRFLHEANPTWRLTSLLWTLEVIGITLIVLQMAERRAQGAERRQGEPLPAFRLPLTAFRQLIFPICFFLVAVPWPSGLETPLVESLKQLNVGATIELLGLSGIPAIRHGNIIELSTGAVGIDEACSGIRSLQATLMISLFFGELYRLSILRRIVLCLTGFVLAFIFNVARTLLLTQIGSVKGIGAIASWHDPAGVTILVGCFICLWLAALLFRRQPRPTPSTVNAQPSPPPSASPGGEGRGESEPLSAPSTTNAQPSIPPSPATHPLTHSPTHPPLSLSPTLDFGLWTLDSSFLLFLASWLVLVEGGTQLWYGLHDCAALTRADWAVQLPTADSAFKTVPIPKDISSQFRYNQGLEGEWKDANGARWQLYYFRWLPEHSLRQRVAIQLAKTHGPEKCLPAIGMTLRTDVGPVLISLPQLKLVLRQYEFEAEGRPIQVFYGIYEDQTGSEVLANRRLDSKARLQAAIAGSRNYGQRFLEVAVWGYVRPEDARAALTRELTNLIKLQ